MNDYQISKIVGTALPLRGDSIDTDRILPARYLRTVTFEGIEQHAFADDRAADENHPFNKQQFENALILIVEQNFGCGSSREHAPQALRRRGFRVIIGASFGEIFFHNAVAIGLPCVRTNASEISILLETIENKFATEIEVDLENLLVKAEEKTIKIELSESAKQQFLQGTWNSTLTLLQAGDSIEATAARLPYFHFDS